MAYCDVRDDFCEIFVERVSVTGVSVGGAPEVLEIFPDCGLREGGFNILGDGLLCVRGELGVVGAQWYGYAWEGPCV